MYVVGVPVSLADCRTLIDLLRRSGRADDLAAAAAIEEGVNGDLYAIGLTEAEQDAVLTKLVDARARAFAELRRVILSTRRRRS